MRRIWVQFKLDHWPETTSHQERQENLLRHIKSCSIRRTTSPQETDRHGISSNKKWKGERGLISTRKLVALINGIENPNENDDEELQSGDLQGVDWPQEFKHGLVQLQCFVEVNFISSRICGTVGQHKTKYVCIVEADESMRIRMEGSRSKNHEYHISGKGVNSLSLYNLGHKFTPMLGAIYFQMQRQQWRRM